VVAPFVGCEAFRASIFDGKVAVLIHVLLNITYGKLFLPGDAYHVAESSCPLGVYSWLSNVRHVGSYYNVPSCQAPKTAASRGQ
jgi:hypothetical protein